MKHAKYGGSTIFRAMSCPGSVNRCARYPELPESSFAAEGTAAHYCLQFLLENQKTLPGARNFLLITHPREMVEHAMAAATYALMTAPDDTEVIAEEKASLGFLGFDAGGPADIHIADIGHTLYVMDFKYGAGIPVSVTDNVQLIFYAVGLMHKYNYDFEDVEITIIQPRIIHPDGPIRSQRIPATKMREWQDKFARTMRECEEADPDIDLNAGSWCHWCAAGYDCPAQSVVKMKQAEIVFSAPVPTIPKVQEMDEAKLIKTLDAATSIERWVKQVRAYAIGRLKRGVAVPGWKLVDSRGVRQWNDAAKTEREARARIGDKAYRRELLSPAQLEKEMGRAWVKKRATAVSSGYTMVPESDPRKAVNPLEDLFDDVDDGL